MAKCPRCGAEIVDPVKSWSMIGKPDRSGEMFKLTIGLYNCDCFDKSFRSVIGKERITLKGIIAKNNSLEEQLMEATSKKTELEGLVKALEAEKTQLLAEVEVLRAVPMLEERVSSLESDIAKLREEKGTLMSRLTKLVIDTPSSVQSAPVEKPLEAYISEAVTIDAPAPLEESVCECHAAETEGIKIVTEAPEINASSTEISAPLDLVVEMPIEEKPAEVPQVEADHVTVVSEEAPVTLEASPSLLCDTLPTEKIVENPIETILTDVTPVEASAVEERPIIAEVVETSPIELATVEVKQVEMPAMEKPVIEIVEVTSLNAVEADVPSSDSQVIAPVIEEKPVDVPLNEVQVEVPVEAVPETTQIVTAPFELDTVHVEKVEEKTSNLSLAEPLIEVKPVEIVPAETTQVEMPTLVEEKPAEIPQPVITSLDSPSNEGVPTGDKLTEPITGVVASVETFDEVISEMAQEVAEEKPVEAFSESTPPNITESVQVVTFEAAQPEMSDQNRRERLQ